MPPKAARSAYSLYFRYCKNLYKNPTLRNDFECNIANKELYKSFIRTVLEDQGAISSVDDGVKILKYMGHNNFTSMSQKIGEEWSNVDELARNIFKELAEEDGKRYKKELYDAYQSFAKRHHVTQASMAELGLRNPESPRHEDCQSKIKSISKPARKRNPTEEKVAQELGSQSNCVEKRRRIDPSTMIHAASMPALDLQDDLLQNQAQETHHSSHAFSSHHLESYEQDHHSQAIGTMQHFDHLVEQARRRIDPYTTIHAASMPTLNLHDDLLQNQAQQANNSSHAYSSYHLETSEQDRAQTNGTMQCFERNTSGIAQVDLTNTMILSMVLSTWNLDPSYMNLPVNDFCHISNDDWLELLSDLTS